MSENVPAVQQPLHDQLGVPEAALALLTPLQKGWLNFAAKKVMTENELKKFELSVQSKLTGILEVKELSKVQEALKESKALQAECSDCRKQLTRLLDEKVTAPLMEYEKRMLASLDPIIAHELALRIEVNKKNDEVAALEREKAAFKAHIINQYHTQATTYKIALNQEIVSNYISALESEMPTEGVAALVSKIKESLPLVARLPFIKYQRTLLEDAPAMEIFKSIPQWDYKRDLQEAIDSVGAHFETYASDLQNATVAAKAIFQENEEKAEFMKDNLQAEISTNNLIAEASPLVLSGGPKVKRELVVVPEETQKWEMTVISLFLKNWQSARPKLKSASEKITIGQMATALGKLATENPNLSLEGLTLREKNK